MPSFDRRDQYRNGYWGEVSKDNKFSVVHFRNAVPHSRPYRLVNGRRFYIAPTALRHSQTVRRGTAGYISDLIGDFSEVQSEARVKAWSRFKEAVNGQTAQLGMTLAQADKSVDTIIDITTRLYKSYRLMRRGQFDNAFRYIGRNARRAREDVQRIIRKANRVPKGRRRRQYLSPNLPVATRDAAENWLAWQYGIAPLYSDLRAALKVMGSQRSIFFYKARSSGSAKTRLEESSRVLRADWSTDYEVRYRYNAVVEVIHPQLHHLARQGLLNVPLVINDLIPFSFVVNWFVNYEPWLEDLTFGAGLNIRHATTSFKIRGVTNYKPWGETQSIQIAKKDYWRGEGIERPSLWDYMLQATATSAWQRKLSAASLAVVGISRNHDLNQHEKRVHRIVKRLSR